MKALLLLLGVFCHSIIYAQPEFETVNRSEVEKAISDSSATTNYAKLLARFQADDSTLTLKEYRLLYYGFVFQKEYSGYPELNQKEINEAMNKKDYDQVIKLCDQVLLKYPINLFVNYNKGLALYMKDKDNLEYIKFRNRYGNIIGAIISSGDGLKCASAFKTIFVNDEYMVMYNYFKVKKFNGQSLESQCDRMSIMPSEYFKAENIYFDTSETFIYMQKMFDKK